MNALFSPPPDVESRRNFIKRVAWSAGALVLEVAAPTAALVASAEAASPKSPSVGLNPFIRIDTQGRVTLVMPQVEMGQGIYTAIAALLADELDVPVERVTLEAAPPDDKLYANPLIGFQVTGGSTSIRAFWTPMRQAGATARTMLVSAAAQGWHVPESECAAAAGVVTHGPSKRRVAYGALVERAARLTPPAHVALRERATFKVIGKPTKRLDTPDKVNGRARFGIDAMPPGFKVATFVSCPVFGGKVRSVDDTRARSIKGVRKIIVLDDLVAVVGDHLWAAKRGLEAVAITWDPGPHAGESTAGILQQHQDALALPGATAKNVGDVDAALATAPSFDVQYRLPFLAHAAMEPMNCTVRVDAGACEVWVGNQVIARTQAIAAKVTGLPLAKVTVHNHLLGGGFGRRLEVDGIETATRIAQKLPGVPLKVIWSREEDIRKAMYRPMWVDRVRARLVDGRIQAWDHKLAGSSVIARWLPGAFKDGTDPDVIEGAVDFPYDTPNLRVQYRQVEPRSVPTCFWRGVGPGHNIFVVESAIDELAALAKQDPVAFRRAHLENKPRLRAALDLATSKAGWGQPLPPRHGRGVSIQDVFGTSIACVAEVVVDDAGHVRVTRYVCAVDCGIAVNPDTVVAQMEGGLIFGLTATLYGEITIEDGRVQQGNFNDYRVVRINEAPAIEVYLIDSGEAPGGIGEPGTVTATACVANAIYAATGVRMRHLPVDPKALAVTKAA